MSSNQKRLFLELSEFSLCLSIKMIRRLRSLHELGWSRCETERRQVGPQDVTMEAPNIKARSQGRLQKRWIDDITAVVGKNWVRSAQDPEDWIIRGVACIQQWMDNG